MIVKLIDCYYQNLMATIYGTVIDISKANFFLEKMNANVVF